MNNTQELMGLYCGTETPEEERTHQNNVTHAAVRMNPEMAHN